MLRPRVAERADPVAVERPRIRVEPLGRVGAVRRAALSLDQVRPHPVSTGSRSLNAVAVQARDTPDVDRDGVARAGLDDAGELPVAEDVLHEGRLVVEQRQAQDEARVERVRTVVGSARTLEVGLGAVDVGVVVAEARAVGIAHARVRDELRPGVRGREHRVVSEPAGEGHLQGVVDRVAVVLPHRQVAVADAGDPVQRAERHVCRSVRRRDGSPEPPRSGWSARRGRGPCCPRRPLRPWCWRRSPSRPRRSTASSWSWPPPAPARWRRLRSRGSWLR